MTHQGGTDPPAQLVAQPEGSQCETGPGTYLFEYPGAAMHSILNTMFATGALASGRSNLLLALGIVLLSGGGALAVYGRRMLEGL